MDVRPTLVADGQAAVLGEPSQRSLHHPAVPPESLAALDPLACDPCRLVGLVLP